MVNFDYDNPLECMPDEPLRSYELLHLYYTLGARRSLAALSKHPECGVSLRSLQTYSAEWQWQERIKRAIELDYGKVQSVLAEQRIEILQDFGVLLKSAIEHTSLEDVTLSQVSTALRAFVDGFAVSFDSLPTRRVQTLNLNALRFEDVMGMLDAEKVAEKPFSA